jgi:hypothetical protein
MESYAKSYVDGLAAQGFFKGGKLGVLYDDGPDWTAVEKGVLERQLAKHGVRVTARASYECRDFTQVSSAEPALNAAVLRFKSAGVNRVISFEPWAGWGFFMIDAKQQHYYPKYGLSSQTAWGPSYATGLAPDDELNGASFVGWSPLLDLSHVPHEWPRLRLCRSIFRDHGVQLRGAIAEAIALSMCDGLLDLAQLGGLTHGALTAETFLRNLDHVRWQSTFMPQISLSRARPDGVISMRPARWDATRLGWVYTGPSFPAAG